MKLWMMFVLSGAVVLLAGCFAGKDVSGGGENLIRIPMVRQATDHTCGMASLQSILGYYGFDCREDILAEKLRVRDHAEIKEIERYMRSLGFQVRQYREMSLEQLTSLTDRGLPVLVCVQAWEPPGTTIEQYRLCRDSGHWVVVIGYDKRNIYVMDPSTLGNYAFVPRDEFVARWHDTDEGESFLRFGMTFESPDPPAYRPGEIRKME